jgi:hypothetical protein
MMSKERKKKKKKNNKQTQEEKKETCCFTCMKFAREAMNCCPLAAEPSPHAASPFLPFLAGFAFFHNQKKTASSFEMDKKQGTPTLHLFSLSPSLSLFAICVKSSWLVFLQTKFGICSSDWWLLNLLLNSRHQLKP